MLSLEWNMWAEAWALDQRAGVSGALPGASCPQPWLSSGTEIRQQPTTNHLQSTQKVLGLKEAGSCVPGQRHKLATMPAHCCSPNQEAASTQRTRGSGAESSDGKGMTFSKDPVLCTSEP